VYIIGVCSHRIGFSHWFPTLFFSQDHRRRSRRTRGDFVQRPGRVAQDSGQARRVFGEADNRVVYMYIDGLLCPCPHTLLRDSLA
jgi:hypothetical protein